MRKGDPGPGSRCVWEGRGWSVFVSDRFGEGRSVSVYQGEGLVVDATLDPYDAPRAGVELRGTLGDLFGPLKFVHETATMHRWVRVGEESVRVTVEVTRQAWRRPRWPGVWGSFEFVEVRAEGRTARSYEGTVGDALEAWIAAEERDTSV